MSHGSQGLFTQIGYNDRMQDDPASQARFGHLPSQVYGRMRGSFVGCESLSE
jgi:hypothetical protein